MAASGEAVQRSAAIIQRPDMRMPLMSKTDASNGRTWRFRASNACSLYWEQRYRKNANVNQNGQQVFFI